MIPSQKRSRLRRIVPATAALAALLAVLLFWRSCCSSEAWWQAAGVGPGAGATSASAPVELLEGRWEGTWSSQARDDRGKLRCIITKLSDDKYHAEFLATYARILTFKQPVDLSVQKKDGPGRWAFKGQSDLGWLAGGVYTYEGHVTGQEFLSTYTASADHGEFRLTRVSTTTAEAPGSQPASRPG